MAWRKRTVVCPFCNQVFKTKMDKVSCVHCGQQIGDKQKKQSSPRFSLKGIIKQNSPRFASKKKKEKKPDKQQADKQQPDKQQPDKQQPDKQKLPAMKPKDSKHKRVKSLRDQMKKAAIHRATKSMDNGNGIVPYDININIRLQDIFQDKGQVSPIDRSRLSPIMNTDRPQLSSFDRAILRTDRVQLTPRAQNKKKQRIRPRERKRKKGRTKSSNDIVPKHKHKHNDDVIPAFKRKKKRKVDRIKDVMNDGNKSPNFGNDEIQKEKRKRLQLKRINNNNNRNKNGVNQLINGYIKTGYDITDNNMDSDFVKETFVHQFMDKKYAVCNNNEMSVDPIQNILDNNWEENAKNAYHWKQKYRCLQQLIQTLCRNKECKNNNNNNKVIPNRFIIRNENTNKICIYLVKWFQKEVKCRDIILKILIPFCKIYKIGRIHSNKLAETLIKKQWKMNNISSRNMVTKALLCIYYASDSRLKEWKPYLIPMMKLRSDVDVRVQVWNFLAGICIFAGNIKNTKKKQKALHDMKTFLSDGWIVRLIRATFMEQYMNNCEMKENYNDKIIISCCQFIFGCNYILTDTMAVDAIYNQVKEFKAMKNVNGSKYAEILLSGDNAFDFNKLDVIKKENLCIICNEYERKISDLSVERDKVTENAESLKHIVNGLRTDNKQYGEGIGDLRMDVLSIDKQTYLLRDDMKDIEVEIFNLKQEIHELQQKQKRLLLAMRYNNKKDNKLDYTNWDKWNVDEVLQWILSLDNNKYLKYANDLYHKLPIENIRGNELCLVNESDLIHFGISNINDRKGLIHHIKSLINNEYKNKEIEISSPPMAFNNDVDIAMPVHGSPFILNNKKNINQHSVEGKLNNNQ